MCLLIQSQVFSLRVIAVISFLQLIKELGSWSPGADTEMRNAHHQQKYWQQKVLFAFHIFLYAFLIIHQPTSVT